jgi:hypothetical protein
MKLLTFPVDGNIDQVTPYSFHKYTPNDGQLLNTNRLTQEKYTYSKQKTITF